MLLIAAQSCFFAELRHKVRHKKHFTSFTHVKGREGMPCLALAGASLADSDVLAGILRGDAAANPAEFGRTHIAPNRLVQ